MSRYPTMDATVDGTSDDSPTGTRNRPRYSIMPEHITRDTRLSSAARLLYVELDGRQGNREHVRVSRGVLAESLGSSLRSVSRAIKELVVAGYLVIKRTGRTSQYRVINLARSKPSVDNSTRDESRCATDGTSDVPRMAHPQRTNSGELTKQRVAEESSTDPAADGGRVETAPAGNVPSERSSKQATPLDVLAFVKSLPEQYRPQPNTAVAQIVETAMGNGWTPGELAAAVRSSITNDQARPGLAVQVAREFSTQPASEHVHRKPARPTWCGRCDERTRLMDVVMNGAPAMMRCPTCHPSSGMPPAGTGTNSIRESA